MTNDSKSKEELIGNDTYTASIRETVSGLYVTEAGNDGVVLGREEDRLLFFDACDAENTLDRLNDEEDGCYTLLREDEVCCP